MALLQGERPTLVGRAVMPADTFVSGPTSGRQVTPNNGRVPPWRDAQPVQGFSAVRIEPGGSLMVLADNGFGTKGNSPDFMLTLYRVRPNFKTRTGGTGALQPSKDGLIEGLIRLSDPNRHVSWPILAQVSAPIAREPGVEEDPWLKERWLTGNDFDPESFRVTRRGDIWVGDEFGPFLLNFDASGRLKRAPIPVPGVKAPESPLGGAVNLPSSRGFEGLALNPSETRLTALLEGTVAGDPAGLLRMLDYDLRTQRWAAAPLFYRLESATHAIGDLLALDEHRYLVIERDNFQGDQAKFKRVFVVDRRVKGSDGALTKVLVVDLLDIADPDRLGTDDSGTFRFPFVTIEAIDRVDDRTLLVLNDNNYPGGGARAAGKPDNTEFILIRLPKPLSAYRVTR